MSVKLFPQTTLPMSYFLPQSHPHSVDSSSDNAFQVFPGQKQWGIRMVFCSQGGMGASGSPLSQLPFLLLTSVFISPASGQVIVLLVTDPKKTQSGDKFGGSSEGEMSTESWARSSHLVLFLPHKNQIPKCKTSKERDKQITYN